MNYYEHHLGDWIRDTAHLSMLEEGAYRRLIDIYYTREQPLPADLATCCRLARATSSPEKAAVKAVLAEFFALTDVGHTSKRCDHEVERFRSKSTKARASAMASVNARIRSDRLASARGKGTHTRAEWAALIDVCGSVCVRCGAEGPLDKDHITPLYQGGSDAIDNLQPLCPRCNSSKGPENADHRPADWRESLSVRSASAQRPLNEGSALQSPDSNLNPSLGCEQPEWTEIRKIYPKRHGSHRWPDALKAVRARLREGVAWDQLLAGVHRYSEFIRAEGKEGTPYVQQAATFFGKGGGYSEPWDSKKQKADPYARAI